MGFLRKSEIREMTEPERAYIGAMIDAEGWVGKMKNRVNLWRVFISNTDPEIISAILRATGGGTVRADSYSVQGKSVLGTKPIFTWGTSRQNNLYSLVDQCASYSMKLQRIERNIT